ncbi:MAG: glutathione S-transferase family protein [Paracoccaceae bacterium]
MKLFYGPNSIARASLITLEEIGVPYEAVRLDLKAGGQRSGEYLAVNPKGRVPALVTDRGTLTETPAILTFLAHRFPDAGLLPDDAFDAARAQEMNAYLCSTVHVSHAHRTRGARWSDDPAVIDGLKVKVARNVSDHFAYLEGRFTGPWVLGETYSIADPYLFVLSGWIGADGVDLNQFPRIAAHHAAMKARPAVQRALAVEGA